MPSFDIVMKVDKIEVSNVFNSLQKECANRYDFKGVDFVIEKKGDFEIFLKSESESNLKTISDMLITAFVRRKIDSKLIDLKPIEKAGLSSVKRTVKLKEGLESDEVSEITKAINSMKLKVKVEKKDTEIRVDGKKIDDLREIMDNLSKLDKPLQFVNFR